MEKKPLKVGIYQGAGTDVAQNMKLMESVLEENKNNSIDLYVFCETFTTGWTVGKDLIKYAEKHDGPSFQRASSLAKKYNAGIVYGYPEIPQERSDSRLFNSAIFIGRNGETLINYHKTHCWSDYEKKYFQNGESLSPIVDFEGWKVAMLICFDVEFPETSRSLALDGAELLLVPTALCSSFFAKHTVLSRAAENLCFLCYVNNVGPLYCEDLKKELQFCGLSVIVAPNGDELVRGDEENKGLLVATLDANAPQYRECKLVNPYFEDRRPKLYSRITS